MLMEDALPSHVSLVDHGANQKPVKVIKIDQKTKADYENKAKLDIASKKNIRTHKSVDTATSDMDIVELFLSKELFPLEEDAIYWLEDGGYEGYEIKETDNGFQVIFSHEGEKYCFSDGGITVCVNKTIKGSSMNKKKSYGSAVKALFTRTATRKSVLKNVSKFNNRYLPTKKEEGSSELEDNLKAEMPVAETMPEGTSEFSRDAILQVIDLIDGGSLEEAKALLNDLVAVSDELAQVPMAEVSAVEEPVAEPVVEEEDKEKEAACSPEDEAKKELAEDGTENKGLPVEPNSNGPKDAETEEKPTAVIQPGSDTAQKELAEDGTENKGLPNEPNTNAPKDAEQAEGATVVATPGSLEDTVAKMAASIQDLKSFVVEKLLDTDEKVSKSEGDNEWDTYSRNSVHKSAGHDGSAFPKSNLTREELDNNFKNFTL